MITKGEKVKKHLGSNFLRALLRGGGESAMKSARNYKPTNQQMLVAWKRVSKNQSYVSKDKDKKIEYGSVWEKKNQLQPWFSNNKQNLIWNKTSSLKWFSQNGKHKRGC